MDWIFFLLSVPKQKTKKKTKKEFLITVKFF